MYTSGSTGPPKVVIVAHSMIISTISSVQTPARTLLPTRLRSLHRLPAPHPQFRIHRRACALLPWVSYRIRSGQGAHRRQCAELRGDLKECASTVMVGVLLIWEMIRSDILDQVEKIPTESKPSIQPSASRWPAYLGCQRWLILWY